MESEAMRMLLLVIASVCVVVFAEANNLKHVWLVGLAMILGEVSDVFRKSPPERGEG